MQNIENIKYEQDCLKKNFFEFQASLEFTQNSVDDKIKHIEKEVDSKFNMMKQDTETQHKELLKKLSTRIQEPQK